MVWGQPRDPFAPTPFFSDFDLGGGPAMPPMAAAVAPPMAKAAGRHGNGLGTRDIIGILADAVLAGTGGTPMYGQMMNRRNLLREQQDLEEDQYQRRQQDEQSQWIARQEYERAHPAAPQPTTLERDVEYYRRIGRPDLADTLLTNRASPMVAVDHLDENGNTVREYVRPSLPQAAPPPRLRQLPPGSQPLPQGGPTPPASGTFR